MTTADTKAERAAELAKLPVAERLQRRIIDGEGKGLDADLELALAEGKPALEIINTDLLAGMKVVGELFGSGQMQLPFVLQSAEVMKTAVGLSRAAPGEDRLRAARAPSCWPRSRATCTTSARTWSTSS